jgi:hypothetical protein
VAAFEGLLFLQTVKVKKKQHKSGIKRKEEKCLSLLTLTVCKNKIPSKAATEAFFEGLRFFEEYI